MRQRGAAEIAYQPWWATQAHVLSRLGRNAEAVAAYDRAIGLSDDPAARLYLSERKSRLVCCEAAAKPSASTGQPVASAGPSRPGGKTRKVLFPSCANLHPPGIAGSAAWEAQTGQDES